MTRETHNRQDKPTRRGFLQTAGLAAAASITASHGLATSSAVGQEVSTEKRSMKLGLASYTLRKFNLEQTLAMTRRVGMDYICLKSFHLAMDSTAEQIARVAEKVKQSGITLYGGGVISMKDEAAAKHAFEYAKAAGMTTIVGAPAPATLPLVNKLVAQYDIQVAIHNHGPGDKTYPTPESIIEKIDGLDKRIGLCMDIGHTLRIGADPIRDAKRYADRLLDVHIKDVSAATPKGHAVEVGRGVIDIPAYLRVLIETGYSGIVSFEYEKDADDPLAGLAESVGYVRGVLAAL